MRVPGSIILAVLGGHARRGAIGSAEHDRAAHLPARHVIGLSRRIDDVINGLHREVEGHELDNRPQAAHRRAGADTGKAVFRDRSINDASRAELLQQVLRDLVGALVLGDLLAHHEHALVGAHLFRHRVAQRLSHRHRHDRRPLGHFGIVLGLADVGHEVAGRRFEHMWSRRGFVLLRFRCRNRRLLGHRRLGLLLRIGDRRGRGRLDALTITRQQGNRLADLHAIGALRHEDLGDLALVYGLELHRSLVGFDLGQDVTRFDVVAFLHQPFGKRPLLHRRRKRGHLELGRHQ